MAAKTKNTKTDKIVVAKESDGTVQITFTVPFAQVKVAQEKVIKEFVKETEIPGFRKGNAPEDKVRESIPANTLLEHTLSHVLPNLLSEALKEHKLNIAIYPKFQVIKAVDNEDWQIRAMTAELPKIVLGDYKKSILDETKTGAIWKPGEEKEKKELEKGQKEQIVIKSLLENVKISIPKIIVDEEVNSRLSNLLQRTEKLGLSLDNYLSSVGKTVESLRAEYEKQADEAIKLDLILNEISMKENITAEEKELTPTIGEIKKNNPKMSETEIEQQKRTFSAMIKKRKTIDYLVSLI